MKYVAKLIDKKRPVFTRSSEAYDDNGNVYANDTPRFKDGGLLIEEATTNLIQSAQAPAQEGVAVTKGDDYALSVYGSGSGQISQDYTETDQADFATGTLGKVEADTSGKLVVDDVADPTFTRASEAVNPDTGASVLSNVPRVVGMGGVLESTENLLTGAYWTSWNATKTYPAIPGFTEVADVVFPNASTVNTYNTVSISCKPSTKYTLSFWIRRLSGSGNIITYISDDDIGNSVTGVNGINATSEWQKVTLTGTTGANATVLSRASILFEAPFVGHVQIADWQLEEKDHATPFVDGVRDEATTNLLAHCGSAGGMDTNTPPPVACPISGQTVYHIASGDYNGVYMYPVAGKTTFYAGEIFSLSLYVYFPIVGTAKFNIQADTPEGSNLNVGALTVVVDSPGWKRLLLENRSFPSTYTDVRFRFENYRVVDWTCGSNECWMAAGQVELKDHATYFTTGTREANNRECYGTLVEEGTENLLPSVAQTFVELATVTGWRSYNGSTVTLTQGQVVPEWGTTSATRIQTSGGTGALKYYFNMASPSVSGQGYTMQIKVKNIGVNTLCVSDNMGNVTRVDPGQKTHIKCSSVGNGANYFQIRLEALNVADSLDFLAFQPMGEAKPYPTSFDPATRTGEVLRIPMTVVGQNQGTIEVMVSPFNAVSSLEYDRVLFSTTGDSGITGIFFCNVTPDQKLRFVYDSNGVQITIKGGTIPNDQLSKVGLCWDNTGVKCLIDGVVVGSNVAPITGIGGLELLVGYSTAARHLDGAFANLRISNKCRTVAEQQAWDGKTVDEFTTYYAPLNDLHHSRVGQRTSPAIDLSTMDSATITWNGTGSVAVDVSTDGQTWLPKYKGASVPCGGNLYVKETLTVADSVAAELTDLTITALADATEGNPVVFEALGDSVTMTPTSLDRWQLEQKAYATSFTPDSRAKDSLTLPIADLMDKDEGKLVFEVTPLIVANWNNYFDMTISTGRFLLYFNESGGVDWDFGPVSSGYGLTIVKANEKTTFEMWWSKKKGQRALKINGKVDQTKAFTPPDSLPASVEVNKYFSSVIHKIAIYPTADVTHPTFEMNFEDNVFGEVPIPSITKLDPSPILVASESGTAGGGTRRDLVGIKYKWDIQTGLVAKAHRDALFALWKTYGYGPVDFWIDEFGAIDNAVKALIDLRELRAAFGNSAGWNDDGRQLNITTREQYPR